MNLSKALVLAREPGTAPGARPSSRSGSRATMPALASVANRTLVRHALDWLDDCGMQEVAIVVPAGAASAVRTAVEGERDWRFETRWLEQVPGERFAESLALLTDFIAGEPFVLHLADSIAKEDLASVVGASVTADDEALLLVQEPASDHPADVIDLQAHRPAPAGVQAAAASVGVAVLGPAMTAAGAALDAFPQRGLEMLGSRVHELGGRVRTCTAKGWWRFHNGADALLEGNRFALQDIKPDYRGATISNADVQGPVIAHPTARIESSVVRGPAILGPRARLIDAYVGPYTSIGPDVVVEGAEIEHSVVLTGASIRHLSGRLEASIIGPHAKVFRDFRLPRALRLHVGEAAEVSVG